MIEWLAVAVAVAAAAAVCGAFASDFAGSVVFTGAFVFSGGFVFAGDRAFANAGSGIIAVAFAFTFGLAFALIGEAMEGDTTILLFFYVLLPFANSCADWVSVSFTRYCLQQTERHRGRTPFLVYTLLDFLAGLAALALLLASLIGLLEFWALFGPPPLDWRAYWAAASTNRSAGIALWLMCFTTLLPTLFHMGWALALWLFDQPERTKMAVQEMVHWDATLTETDQTPIARRIADDLMKGKRIVKYRFALVFLALAFGTIWFEIFTLTTLFPVAS